MYFWGPWEMELVGGYYLTFAMAISVEKIMGAIQGIP